ncbi:hypothetical protein [Methylobacterium mesophilicum]
MIPIRRRAWVGRKRRPGVGPLVLWRTRTPEAVSPDELNALQRALPTLAILGDRRWPAARAGDPAAAAAAAIERIGRDGPVGIPADIVLSNLFLVALGGDATARLVLAHAIRRLSRRRPELTNLPRIARAWAYRQRVGARQPRTARGA